MASELEDLKLQAEVDKLRAETASLRRMFAKPSDWIAVVVGLGGILTALAQWQVSAVQKEKTALEAERRTFDAEKRKREMEEQNQVLTDKVARQQKALGEIEDKIQQRSEVFAKLSDSVQGQGTGARNLVQQAQRLDEAIAASVKYARVEWKGKEFKAGDHVRIHSRAGTFKPEDTGHSVELDGSPGHEGLVLGGEKRKASDHLKPDANEPIQIVRVRWPAQVWTEYGTEKQVAISQFESTIHVDYLEVVKR